MSALEQAHANNLIDGSLGTAAFTVTVTPITCRLMTANGSATSAGTELATGGGYTSGAGAPTITFGPARGELALSNVQIKVINMPACTVVGIELWDSTAITPARKWFGALASPKQLNAGDTFTINIGALSAALS